MKLNLVGNVAGSAEGRKGDHTMKLNLSDRTTEDLQHLLIQRDVKIAPQHRKAIRAELERRAGSIVETLHQDTYRSAQEAKPSRTEQLAAQVGQPRTPEIAPVPRPGGQVMSRSFGYVKAKLSEVSIRHDPAADTYTVVINKYPQRTFATQAEAEKYAEAYRAVERKLQRVNEEAK